MKGLDRGLGKRGKRVRQGLMKIRRVGMGWHSLEGKSSLTVGSLEIIDGR